MADTFSERLKWARQELGLSFGQLATKSTISKAYLWQMEQGGFSPTLKTLQILSRALDVSVAFLVVGTPAATDMLSRARHAYLLRFVDDAEAVSSGERDWNPFIKGYVAALIDWERE